MEKCQTSWGENHEFFDVRALHRYNGLLSRAAAFAEACILVVILALTVAAIYAVYVNYENIIFFDGTDVVCIYDGSEDRVITVQ